jgi:hypothetical protein
VNIASLETAVRLRQAIKKNPLASGQLERTILVTEALLSLMVALKTKVRCQCVYLFFIIFNYYFKLLLFLIILLVLVCVCVSFATNFKLPSQQSAIDELMRETSASLAEFGKIATQPLYGFNGEKKWYPADSLVGLELPPLQFDARAKLDARLPRHYGRSAAFGRFEEENGTICYYPTTPGLLGGVLKLEAVDWSPEQILLVEMVGCLLFSLFILLLFFKKKHVLYCVGIFTNSFLYSLSTQEGDLKQEKLASLGYNVPPGPSNVRIGDFLAAFAPIAEHYRRYKDPDEPETAIESIKPAAPLQPTTVCTIEQRGHVPPTKSTRTQVVRGFFSIFFLSLSLRALTPAHFLPFIAGWHRLTACCAAITRLWRGVMPRGHTAAHCSFAPAQQKRQL